MQGMVENSNVGAELLASSYDDTVVSINKKIEKIRSTVKKYEPLQLLVSVADRNQLKQVHYVGEEVSDNSLAIRGAEYIQSLYAAEKMEVGHKKVSRKIVENLLDDIEALFTQMYQYYVAWAAKESITSDILSTDDITYILESQMAGNVRGNRYQFQQTNGIVHLLETHEKVLNDEFGESTASIAEGLHKLEYALSSQRFDAFKTLFGKYEFYYDRSKGKSKEKQHQILEEINNNDDMKQIMSLCAGDAAFNVKKITGWSDALIESLSWRIGEYEGTFSNDEFYAWWPINELPIQKRPFIIINDVSYCFDYYSLFDNFYRAIQDAIFRADKLTKDDWQKYQKIASEQYVSSLFKKIFPSADIHEGNYYPVRNSTKQMDENDILLSYDECLIVIEVKAGKFTPRPAIIDYASHKKSFTDLIGRANSQAERTINYIKSRDNATFYNEDKEPQFTISNKDYKYYYSFVVTVDNIDEFECRIQQMHFLDVGVGTITINIDDLELYVEYFDSSLEFMHFLQERVKASSIKMLQTFDELDHLGMYISQNLYTEMVHENAADENYLFIPDGFREELDQYFNGLHEPLLSAEKPSQQIPERINEIIRLLEKEKPRGCIEFSSFVLNWTFQTREQVDSQILPLMKRQRELKRMIPLYLSGESMMLACYVEDSKIQGLDDEQRDNYLLANLINSSLDECWRIDLNCSSDGHVNGVKYKKLTREDIKDDEYEGVKKYSQYILEQRKIQMARNRWAGKKIYPNDSCPCGSGKKYKKCCGKP